MGNIGKESNEQGIIDFFKYRGVPVTQVHLFKTRSGGLSAKLNVPSTFCHILEADEFLLPDGVFGRKWEYKRKRRDHTRYPGPSDS